MTSDRDVGKRLQTFLGEFRILVPALSVLLGFQLQTSFQSAWSELTFSDRVVDFAAVACTTLALVFILVPPSVHRMSAGAVESESFLRFAQRQFAIAFVFFALSLVLSLALQARRTFGAPWAVLLVAGAALLVVVLGWWVVPRRRLRVEGVPHRREA